MSRPNIYLERPWLQYYPEEVPKGITVPDISLGEAFDQATDAFPQKPALVFYGTEISFQNLRNMVDKFAHAISQLGVQKGDKIVLHLFNCPQLVIAYFGAFKAGAVVSVVSPAYTADELKFLLEDSEAKLIVSQDLLYPTLKKSGSNPQNIIIANSDDFSSPSEEILGSDLLKAYEQVRGLYQSLADTPGVYSFQKLLDQYPPQPPQVTLNPKNDVAAIPYTGGTTAKPKGAMLTHSNLIAEHIQFKAVWPMLKPGEEVFPAFLPFSHIFGQALCMVHGILMGASLLIFSTPNMQHILQTCEHYKATIFTGVPTLYEMLKEHPAINMIDWKRYKILMAAGDALRESTANDWKEKTGSQLFEGYGLTETSGAVFANPYDRPKIGSMGCPMPGVWGAVISPEDGKPVSVGEVGELVISGSSVMKGYWKREEDNQEVFLNFEGKTWFRTGDLVRMDEEGYFHYYSRSKDLIKYKGYSVFAREIEEVIAAHPQVSEVAVVGIPDAKVGEYVKSYVVLHSETKEEIGQGNITSFCQERLAHFKIPRIVEFRDQLPKTNVGKLLKRALKEEG